VGWWLRGGYTALTSLSATTTTKEFNNCSISSYAQLIVAVAFEILCRVCELTLYLPLVAVYDDGLHNPARNEAMQQQLHACRCLPTYGKTNCCSMLNFYFKTEDV
jgi:hypothetical protein